MWDVSSVTHMSYMFSFATSFNGDISKWDVSKVKSMNTMFQGATSFNSDISKWDVSRLISMAHMFEGASSFSQTLCGAWLTAKENEKSEYLRSTNKHGRKCSTSTTVSTISTTVNGKTTPTKTQDPNLPHYTPYCGAKHWTQTLSLPLA